MATGVAHPTFGRTIKPTTAVPRYYAVKADGTGPCTTADERIGGVVQASIDANTQGVMTEDGDVIWEAAAAINDGAAVTTNNAGRCVTAGVGEKEQGRAKMAASGAGHQITVKLSVPMGTITSP